MYEIVEKDKTGPKDADVVGALRNLTDRTLVPEGLVRGMQQSNFVEGYQAFTAEMQASQPLGGVGIDMKEWLLLKGDASVASLPGLPSAPSAQAQMRDTLSKEGTNVVEADFSADDEAFESSAQGHFAAVIEELPRCYGGRIR